MKKSLFIISTLIVCIFVVHLSAAQESGPKTKLSLFKEKFGSSLIEGSEVIAKMGKGLNSVEVEVEEFIAGTNTETTKRELGIMVIIIDVNGAGSASWVDYEEIDALIKGINFVSKANSSATQLKNFKATYSTENGLCVSQDSQGKLPPSVRIPSGFDNSISITGPNQASFTCPLEQLDEFKDAIAKAKEKLDTLKKTDMKNVPGK